MTIFIPNIIIILYVLLSFIYYAFLIKANKLVFIDNLIVLNNPNGIDLLLLPLFSLPLLLISVGVLIVTLFISINDRDEDSDV